MVNGRLVFQLLFCSSAIFPAVASCQSPQKIDLPTSKQILEPVAGSLSQLNSLPMDMAWSPDQRYLAIINAGYGTPESKYQQSIAILDTQPGVVRDFPDARTAMPASQTMYQGIAFSLDGKHLYASFDSLSVPEGDGQSKTG